MLAVKKEAAAVVNYFFILVSFLEEGFHLKPF